MRWIYKNGTFITITSALSIVILGFYISYLLAHSKNYNLGYYNNISVREYVLKLVKTEILETGIYNSNLSLEVNLWNMVNFYFENFNPPRYKKCLRILKILYVYLLENDNKIKDDVVEKLILIGKKENDYNFLEILLKKELERIQKLKKTSDIFVKKKEFIYLLELLEVLSKLEKFDEVNGIIRFLEKNYPEGEIRDLIKVKKELYAITTK